MNATYNLPMVALACVLLASCATVPSEVRYAISTKSPLSCCRKMEFTVATFSPTVETERDGDGVEVRFGSDRLVGHCLAGGEAPLVVANHTDDDVLIPTSRELEGTRIKLYPWRLHHDPTRGDSIRIARQIQFGDLIEHEQNARLVFMRLPWGHQVSLTAWVPGTWLCTKPTPLTEGYMERELEPDYYAHHYQRLRTAAYDQASELVSPIGLRYDVVWLTLDFLETLPVASRSESPAGDTVAVVLDVRDEPAKFLNASQRVASSNVIDLVIKK